MRLARLELRAYGHFTGCALELGTGSGLHLVQGDNEAGKSTTLRALSSLLFGYPHKAEDTFRHQPRDIALGGRLVRSDGSALDVVRRRTGRDALVDGAGHPLDEAALALCLGGVGRALFERVFALDHRRLREHASALLAERGELGTSLAAAGAGIVGLGTVLDGLRGERDGLFLPKGQRVINQQIRRLEEQQRRARQLTLSPESYHRLTRAIAAEGEKHAANRARRRIVAGEVARLDRRLRNLPRAAARAELVRARAALGGGPFLPEAAVAQRARIETATAAASRALATAESEGAALATALAAIAVDDGALARGEEIAALGDVRGRILGESEDLPRREAALREREDNVARLRRDAELTLPEGETEMVPAPRRQGVRRLAGIGRTLATRAEERRQAVIAARDRREAAEAARRAAPAAPETGALARAVERATGLGSDIAAQLARRRRALAAAEAALAARVAALGVSDGSIAQLQALPLPTAGAARAAVARLDALAGDLAGHARAGDPLAEEAAQIERELAALAETGIPPTEADITAARAARDRGWALVRGLHLEGRADLAAAASAYAGDLPLPDAFATRIVAADGLVDAWRRDRDRAVRHDALIRRGGDVAARLAALAERRQATVGERDEARAGWDALWQRSGLFPLPPAEAIEWLAAAAATLAEATALERQREELAAPAEQMQEARAQLVAALVARGEAAAASDPFDATLAEARAVLDDDLRRAQAQGGLGRDAAEAHRRLDESERRLRDHERSVAEWQVEWQAAIAAIGLPAGADPDLADGILEIITKLDEHYGTIADLRHRIAAMRADRARFDTAVVGLAGALMPAARFADTIEASRALERHYRDAEENAGRRLELGKQREAAAARAHEARSEIARLQAALAQLCAEAGGVLPAELPAVEVRSAERRRIDAELAHLEAALIGDGGGHGLAAIVADCAGVDSDAVAADLADAQELLKTLDDQNDALVRALTMLEKDRDDTIDSEQAAAVEQEAASTAASLAEEVERYAALTVEETLLRAAVELYRERHQGPVLRRASTLFAALTEDAYRGLRTDFDDKDTALVLALDAAGATREIEALSDGTRDQLYLALRLAVVFEHNAGHEPVPFIADDLLVNFDDRRAAAALRVLAAEAATTQVLLFTHHAHLAELARRAVPGQLSEHRLERPAPAPA